MSNTLRKLAEAYFCIQWDLSQECRHFNSLSEEIRFGKTDTREQRIHMGRLTRRVAKKAARIEELRAESKRLSDEMDAITMALMPEAVEILNRTLGVELNINFNSKQEGK